MISKIIIRNFKRFDEAVLDFSADPGLPVVLIGPNNSGKTTALQALSLWRLGLSTLLERSANGKDTGRSRGFTINRRDLANVPVPSANLLWKGVRTSGIQGITSKTRIEIEVQGLKSGTPWVCGLEFDYTNEESFSCRPLRHAGQDLRKVGDCTFSTIPDEAKDVQLAFLPPMSGLASVEPRADAGRIDVLLGEGQTAQVIRNLCYTVFEGSQSSKFDGTEHGPWDEIVSRIKLSFGVELEPPEYIPARGEVRMSYRDLYHDCSLDLSSAGRGLQQTLLLLAYMYARPGSVLLLDEPDAHLEVLRQRSLFEMIREVAKQNQSQVIAASHSEIVLGEAASHGTVIAFVGKPHRVNDKTNQVLKSLTSIGFDHYYQAELRGWVLYLEGPTDLAILRAFAEKLGHEAAKECLREPFIHYLGNNQPQGARDHFFALKEAVPDLVGYAHFDRLSKPLNNAGGLCETQWARREIENYLCTQELLLRVAQRTQEPQDLFTHAETRQRVLAMTAAIDEVTKAAEVFGKPSLWSVDTKASDDVLEPIFKSYAKRLGLPIEYHKRDYHTLVAFLDINEIDAEIAEVLERIVSIAQLAKPLQD